MDVANSPSILVVSVEGDLDLSSIPGLRSRMEQALATRPGLVVLELSAVRFVDSAGLSALLWCVRRGRQAGVTVQLSAPSRAVTRLLEVTGSERCFSLAS